MLCHWIPHPNFSCVACGYKLASNEKQSIYSDTKIKGPCPQQKAKPYFLYCLNQSVKYTTIIAVITMTFLTDGIFFNLKCWTLPQTGKSNHTYYEQPQRPYHCYKCTVEATTRCNEQLTNFKFHNILSVVSCVKAP